MESLWLRLGKAKSGGVDNKSRNAQQLHGRSYQAGGDDVIDKESTIIGKEHTPSGTKIKGRERGPLSTFW